MMSMQHAHATHACNVQTDKLEIPLYVAITTCIRPHDHLLLDMRLDLLGCHDDLPAFLASGLQLLIYHQEPLPPANKR